MRSVTISVLKKIYQVVPGPVIENSTEPYKYSETRL